MSESIGSKLRTLRKSRHFSQQYVADQVGIDRVELYLVVSPFDYIGDNRLDGQPHCRLRIKAKKDELQ